MATVPIRSNLSSALTDGAIRSAPARLLALLQGMGQSDIRVRFARAGLTEERKEQGWSLFDDLKRATAGVDDTRDPVEEATTTCETFANSIMIRGRAILQLSYPDQADYLFRDFTPGMGAMAVLNVSTFLIRARDLATGADRKATRKADHDALSLLDELGVTKETLRELTDAATTARSDMSTTTNQAERDAQRNEVVRRMHAWVTAWSDIARTLGLNRDQLIRLGIARRRSRKAKVAPIVVPIGPGPSPAPTAPLTAPLIAEEDPGPRSRAA
jgi:hypothetical protein